MLSFNLYLYCSGQGLNVDLIWEMKIEVKAADLSFAIELNFYFLEWPHRQAGRTNLVEHSKFTSNLQMIYKENAKQNRTILTATVDWERLTKPST